MLLIIQQLVNQNLLVGISDYLSNYSLSLTQRNTVNNYFLISGGENHSIILNNEGSFSFGSNYYGQLGNVINNGSDKYNLGLNLKNASQEDYNNILSVLWEKIIVGYCLTMIQTITILFLCLEEIIMAN